jgi:hypothetical protein
LKTIKAYTADQTEPIRAVSIIIPTNRSALNNEILAPVAWKGLRKFLHQAFEELRG